MFLTVFVLKNQAVYYNFGHLTLEIEALCYSENKTSVIFYLTFGLIESMPKNWNANGFFPSISLSPYIQSNLKRSVVLLCLKSFMICN